jgi:hypothetical protein
MFRTLGLLYRDGGDGWLSNGMLGAAGLRFVVLCVQQVCVLPR